MSHYGISAIHWNAALGAIDEVRLHRIVRGDRAGEFKLAPGEPAWCSDVVALIQAGHTVWVVAGDGRGKHVNTAHVRFDVGAGGHMDLYSCARDGTRTSALRDLPRYERPEDSPVR